MKSAKVRLSSVSMEAKMIRVAKAMADAAGVNYDHNEALYLLYAGAAIRELQKEEMR